jgi:hypothetical protein
MTFLFGFALITFIVLRHQYEKTHKINKNVLFVLLGGGLFMVAVTIVTALDGWSFVEMCCLFGMAGIGLQWIISDAVADGIRKARS